MLLLRCSLSLASTQQDVSRIDRVEIDHVVSVRTEADVIGALEDARIEGKQVVIAGAGHSQGGHILYPNAVMLDMRGYDRVLNIDTEHKTITVQAGATWAQVQEAINPQRLAVAVMQSSNIFSVGGSISANIHGRHTQQGPIISTVRSMRIALANGQIVTASRDIHPELFSAAIGGFGTLGVILDATLQLVDDQMLIKTVTPVDFEGYAAHLRTNASALSLHYGRCSIAPGERFLEECFAIDYRPAGAQNLPQPLQQEAHVARDRLLFNWSRGSNIGKTLRWELQKGLLDKPGSTALISRNNAMRPPIRFLDYSSETDTDILQEYFVPLDEFPAFMRALKNVVQENEVNLLSVTLRYVHANTENLLPYATQNQVAVVLYINMDLNESALTHAEQWTRMLVDRALEHSGTYYLVYQRFPTIPQFQRAYPSAQALIDCKLNYDPGGVFNNLFYQHYLGRLTND